MQRFIGRGTTGASVWLWLLVAAPLLADEAPTVSELVQQEARRLLTTFHTTRYTPGTAHFDEDARTFDCNCTGFVDYVVRRVAGLDSMQHTIKQGRPRAIDFHTVLAAPEKSPIEGLWENVPRLLDAVPGDIIAWRRANHVSGATGHVVVLDTRPIQEPDGLVRVVVIDSTSRPHADDTRRDGQTGIGRGTMWFKVDQRGAPVAYVREARDNRPVEEPIAIGRLARAATAGDERPLRLTVLGQALIAHDLREQPYEGFEELSRRLRQADVCFSNLETAIRADGAGEPTKTGLYLHTADPDVLDCLREMGIRLLSLSNNHTGDLGSGGVLAAIREVRRRGFVAGGAGENLTQAAAPVYLQTARGSVALVAVASQVPPSSIATAERPGVNHLTIRDGKLDETEAERNLSAIRQAAAEADYVLAYQHNHYWEPDNRRTPEWQRAWARACIDAGATLFVGHGVPLLHGIEIYQGRPIFYCLGNLVFHTRTPAGHYPTAVWQSVVADCYLAGGNVVELKLRAIGLTEGEPGDDFFKTRGRPRFAEGEEARRILTEMERLSEPYGTRMDRTDDELTIRLGALE